MIPLPDVVTDELTAAFADPPTAHLLRTLRDTGWSVSPHSSGNDTLSLFHPERGSMVLARNVDQPDRLRAFIDGAPVSYRVAVLHARGLGWS